MNTDTDADTVEIAILSTATQYDNYEDSHEVISTLITGEDWITVSKKEHALLVKYRYHVAKAAGVDGVFIIEKPSKVSVQLCLDALKEIVNKADAEEAARLRKQERTRLQSAEKDKERKVAKAKKALEKAQIVLKEAGVI